MHRFAADCENERLHAHLASKGWIKECSYELDCFPKVDEVRYELKMVYNFNENSKWRPNGLRVSTVTASSTGAVQSLTSRENVRCEYCVREFTTKNGLGLHMKSAHPVEYQAVQAKSLRLGNRRWSDEERTVLANYEIEAIESGTTGSMNAYLASRLLGRTTDGIKGQRRDNKYLAILEKLRAERRTVSTSALDTDSETSVDGVDAIVSPLRICDNSQNHEGDSLRETLRGKIKVAIGKLARKSDFKAPLLVGAAKSALHSRGSSNRMMDWLNCVMEVNKRAEEVSQRNKSQVIRPGGKKVQSRKARKISEYAHIQRLFKRDPKKAAKYVLSDPVSKTTGPSAECMVDFWKNIYEHGNEHHVSQPCRNAIASESANRIWAPISAEEVKKSELVKSSASGIDGITVAQWRALPPGYRALFYNLILYKGDIGDALIMARTVFIPKKDNPTEPGDYRPISICSVVARQLHRILAGRLHKFHSFDERQRAFCNVDGTAANLLVLKSVLRDSTQGLKELHMTSIDIKKAFDSVTHDSVLEAITRLGCPTPFVKYMQSVYKRAKTVLMYKGSTEEVCVNRGVLQGDPISPIVFNYLMDQVLNKLRNDLGYTLQGTKVSCIAYADDIIILSGTMVGMQYNINLLAEALRELNLQVNVDKTRTLSLVPQSKEKKLVYLTSDRFKIDDQYIKQIGPLDTWKYLGLSMVGTIVGGVKPTLLCDLEKVKTAPMKPQQKIQLLKTFVLSRFYHTMVLGEFCGSEMRALDKIIRDSVRTWLRFPHDTPNAYFYVGCKNGGLGLPCLELDIPRIRLRRLDCLKESHLTQAIKKSKYYIDSHAKCVEKLTGVVGGVDKSDSAKYWETELESMVDTKGLTESRHCGESSSWIGHNSNRISGQDYVHYHHIRLGILPTLARRSRGSVEPRQCRFGCASSETNYHVIQTCARTQGGRILRHNRVLQILHEALRPKHKHVYREMQFWTGDGYKIPDLTLTNGHTAVVIDVHVVRGEDMAKDRLEKVMKYQNAKGLSEEIRKRLRCKEVVYEALTVSYRGIFEKSSAELLSRLRITREVMFMMCTSVLRGTWLNWHAFKKATRP